MQKQGASAKAVNSSINAVVFRERYMFLVFSSFCNIKKSLKMECEGSKEKKKLRYDKEDSDNIELYEISKREVPICV